MQPMILFRFVARRHLIPVSTFTEKLAFYMQSLLIKLLITNFVLFELVITSEEISTFAAFSISIYVA